MHHVYRNLHKNKWSVKSKKVNRVTMHRNTLVMKNCLFWVSEPGRKRVLQEKRKNVHAMVRGNICNEKTPKVLSGWLEVSYNPYQSDKFFEVSSGVEVIRAKKVIFTPDMKVYASGIEYSK